MSATPHQGTVATAAELAPQRRLEWLRLASLGASGLAVAFFLGLVGLFVVESLPVLAHEGLAGYLGGTTWFYRGEAFGVASMIYATVVVAGLALLLAAPVGLGAAVLTAEILPARWRLGVKMTVELLAGVPSVVYGLLGVLVLRQWIYGLLAPFDPVTGDSLLTAGVLLAVMTLPTVATLADDALSAVARSERLAARALGLTRAEAICSLSLRRAFPGLVAALLLALGRGLGETIAVFLVVGRQDNQWPERLLSLRSVIEPGQTLTTKLGGSETFIAYGDPLHWAAMVGLGLVLLVLVGGVTWVGALLMRRGSGSA